MLPDEKERNIFLDWLAFCVQNPGKKIYWAILLQGKQGTGKSYYGYLMRLLLGERNVCSPSNDAIHEPYTSWQKSTQLIVIEELMARGRLELMNKLKPMITQEIAVVREMYKVPYEQPNVFNLLLFTNHEDAIIINKNDRRYCVMFSKAEPREPSYYKKLWDWTSENADRVLYLLQHRNLSSFLPTGHAPMTEGKRELITLSLPPLQAWISECIESDTWPFMGDLVTTTHLAGCLPRSLSSSSPQAIGRALKAIGAQPLGQVRMPNGQNFRLWSIKRHETWKSAKANTIAEEYLKWSSSEQPGGNPLLDARPM